MKKVLSLILLTIMLITLTLGSVSANTNTPAKSFSDVPRTHWAYNYIATMATRGIINGYSDGTFKPSNKVTRAEWAKLLTMTAEIPLYNDYKTIISNCATDVKTTDWSAPYLVTAMPYFSFEETYSGGKTNVTYSPSKPATRLEITKSIIIEKGYSLANPDLSLVMDFRDYTKIPKDDMKYIAVAVEKGIINGFNDKTFRPHDNLTRAEAATILYRAYIEDDTSAQAKKPYTMQKLVSAEIDESVMATVDNQGNLFYIDRKDNCVYKISVFDRIKVKYYDPTVLEREATDDEGYKKYSNYIPGQVYYDSFSGKLILSGVYTNLAVAGQKEITDGKFTHMYDITRNDAVELYCVPATVSNSFPKGYWSNIQTIFNNDYIFTGGYYNERVERESGEHEGISVGETNSKKAIVLLNKNGQIYCWGGGKSYGYIRKLDGESWDSLINSGIPQIAFGIHKEFYYLDSKDKKIYKINPETLMFDDIGVTVDSSHVDFADMTNISKVDIQFHIISDSTFIFYDTGIKAFTILEPTPVQEEQITKVDTSEFFKKYGA